jgi:hypothetical protein
LKRIMLSFFAIFISGFNLMVNLLYVFKHPENVLIKEEVICIYVCKVNSKKAFKPTQIRIISKNKFY